MSCAGDHVYRLFYLAVGKLADIPFRDVNFLRYFGCSNICFLEFFISLANSRLTWRIVAPTRRKIARKVGDISKRIDRDILSHYFRKLPHTNTSSTSFFGWTCSTSCAFLRLAVTLVTSCGFLRLDFQQGLEGGVLIPHSHSFTTRIPHHALFSSLSRISFLLSQKYIKKD